MWQHLIVSTAPEGIRYFVLFHHALRFNFKLLYLSLFVIGTSFWVAVWLNQKLWDGVSYGLFVLWLIR